MLLNEGDSSTTEGATRATQFIEPHAVNPTTNVPSMLSNEGGSSTTEGATRATHLIEAPTMDPTANVPSTNEGDSSTTEGATRATSPTSAVQATAPSLLHPLPWEPLVEYVGTGEEPDLLPPPYEDVKNVGAEDPIPPLVPMQESATQGTDVTGCRSNHTKCPSWRKQEYIDSHLVQVMESIVVSDDDPISGEQPLLAYADSSDPDILTLSQLMKPKRAPLKANTILRHDSHLLPHCVKWDYRSVIGKLNFLEKSTRPDISFAVHQCAWFSIDLRISHTEAVMQIGLYLLGTRDKGYIMSPKEHSLDCWVDSDFAGNWAKDCVPIDVDNV